MDDNGENARLRRAFDRLPKIPGHGETVLGRHTSIRQEWIMKVIAGPYERYEVVTTDGERRTILTGRVPESNHWIMVVFVGDPETGMFLTAYTNRGLVKKYGGLPWEIP